MATVQSKGKEYNLNVLQKIMSWNPEHRETFKLHTDA